MRSYRLFDGDSAPAGSAEPVPLAAPGLLHAASSHSHSRLPLCDARSCSLEAQDLSSRVLRAAGRHHSTLESQLDRWVQSRALLLHHADSRPECDCSTRNLTA